MRVMRVCRVALFRYTTLCHWVIAFRLFEGTCRPQYTDRQRRIQEIQETFSKVFITSFNTFNDISKFLWRVEEYKTNLMSLVILFHFLCAQHVSDINISIIRSFRLCCWITTSVVLFSVRCVLEIWCGWSLQHGHYSNPATPNFQHTTNWEQDDRCGNSTTQSQAPDDGYINVRNMLST